MTEKTMDARPKLVRIDKLDYVKSEVGGEVPYKPIGDRIIVRVDEIAARTTGGIDLPFEMIERQNAGSQTGVIVAIGDAAFHWTFDRAQKWDDEHRKPQVGERVFFERYAGAFVPGADGKWYRIMDDKCVAAIEAAPADQAEADPKRIDVV